MYVLTAEGVDRLFKTCLFADSELDADGKPGVPPVVVQGIMMKVGFHPDRVREYEPEIKKLLAELPENLKEGVSFLTLCVDRQGNQWGEHRNMEQLMCLGMAIDMISCPMPREFWKVLPGGVPYYMLKEAK